MDLTFMAVSMNHVTKEKTDSIPVILRDLLEEISIPEKTLPQRTNCVSLKEQCTQLKEICSKISTEIKFFFLPCPKSQFLEWTDAGPGVSL